MPKTINEINEKINKGTVKVVRADEMTRIIHEIGPEKAAEEVDVVTTGTFGAMCSSGVWLNFGHADPPIKMTKVWMNEVEAYAGVAAVDAYLGATQPSENKGIEYGGAHVIEDLLDGKEVILRAISYGTDCYPRKEILTKISLNDLNTAMIFNPRNAYQRYNAATNCSEKEIYTYMGKLLPGMGNINYSGSGELSPLMNDPNYITIGKGTRIFIGGAKGYVVGPGTQHNPQNSFGTLMVEGDLKKMSVEFVRAATFKGYGCSLYIGIGIPIPILNADMARSTGISDSEIFTDILDYSVQSRNRPALKRVSYADLKSGLIEIKGKKIPTAPISSFYFARKIAEILKTWILKGEFVLSIPVETLTTKAKVNPLEIKQINIDARKEKISEIESSEVLIWREFRCTYCGLCIEVCKTNVFKRIDDWKISVTNSLCIACGDCLNVCPVNALQLKLD